MTDTIKMKAMKIKAIMKSKTLSESIQKALQEPIGSSKRESALGILSSLDKAIGRKFGKQDGQGGIGDTPSSFKLEDYTKKDMAVGESNPLMGGDKTKNGEQTKSSAIASTGKVIGSLNNIILPGAPESKPKDVADTNIDINNLKQSGLDINKILGTTEIPANYYDDWYGKLNTQQKSSWKPLYDALKSGMGKEEFALSMLGNKEQLKKLPGFEGLSDEELPYGASLTRTIGNLEDTLRKESGLTEIENKLKNKQNQGLSITTDLTDYITARDENISTIDNMLDKTKETMAGMDLSDPGLSRRMKNYTNYLTVLKGRQQKRYVDYLNMGINQFNNELTQIKNDYTSLKNSFDNELKTKTAITTEDYNRFSNALKNMYSNLEGKEQKEYEKNLMKISLLDESYKTLKTVLDATNSGGADILTADQKNTANAYGLSGLGMNQKTQKIILDSLSGTNLNKYISALKEKIKTNENLDIEKDLTEWINAQKSNIYNPFEQ